MFKLFVIMDLVAGRAGPSFQFETLGEAERYFLDGLVNAQKGSLWASHPETFALYHIGEYDNKTMAITAVIPVEIARGKKVAPAEEAA